MAYEVLARKWRPQQFAEVVGQEHVTTTLVNALRQDRVAHAYLMSGLRGVGKTTTARILAKALNCEEGPTPTPCGKCIPCQEVMRGTSMDCLEIDGASNRGIEEIRTLKERIGYAPVGGKKKVYIIDEVHMLTTEAFNALLKTLEEPPPHAVFILATTHPRKVPPTILSRCQRFHFRRIPTAAIEEHLGKVAQAEGLGVSAEALGLVARKADGSLRDAESLLEQVAALGEGKVSAADCRSFLGLMEDEYFFSAGRALFSGEAGRLMELIEELLRQGGDPVEFAEGLTYHLRHLLVASIDAESPALGELSREEVSRYRSEIEKMGSVDILSVLEEVGALLPALRRSRQPRLELEVALLSLANRASTGSLVRAGEEKESRPPEAKATTKAKAKAKPKPATRKAGGESQAARFESEEAVHDEGSRDDITPETDDAETAPAGSLSPKDIPAFTLDSVRRVWSGFMGEVRHSRRALAAFLASAVPHKVEGNRVVLAFPVEEKFSMNQVRGKENRHYLAEILGRKVGQPVMLACQELSMEPPDPAGERGYAGADVRETPGKRAAYQAPEITEREPAVRKLLEAFDGEILAVRENPKKK